jgi:hypothetical protein
MMPFVPGPASPNDPYRGAGERAGIAPLSSTTRWVYLGMVVMSCLGFFGAVALWVMAFVTGHDAQPNESLMIAAGVVFAVMMLFLYGHIFVGIYWVYRVWEWLPPNQRYTRHWKSWITPAQASLYLLVPYFHYYWMFVINTGLCDAFDRMRVTHPTREAGPKSLAIAAGVSQLVIPLPVGAIMWFVFMSKVERLTREMSESPHRLPAGGWQSASPVSP